MALSVIVMPSGHTFVQHLVMLHKPMPDFFRRSLNPVLRIQRVHLQRGRINQKSRTDELLVHMMVAQHVANVLAEKAFDALAKLLHPVHILLRHSPCAVWRHPACAA